MKPEEKIKGLKLKESLSKTRKSRMKREVVYYANTNPLADKRFSLVPILPAVSTVMAIALLFLPVSILLAQSTPGSQLYPLKKFIEKGEGAVASVTGQKNEFKKLRVERRVDELEKTILQGNEESQSLAAKEVVETASEKVPDPEPVARRIKEAQKKAPTKEVKEKLGEAIAQLEEDARDASSSPTPLPEPTESSKAAEATQEAGLEEEIRSENITAVPTTPPEATEKVEAIENPEATVEAEIKEEAGSENISVEGLLKEDIKDLNIPDITGKL